MKRRILFVLILMGFTSLIAQATFLREFLVAFYGNEFTIGIILACWIITKAAGSGLASRFAGGIKWPFNFYAAIQALIAIYLPLSIFFIRDAKTLLAITPGEAIGTVPMFISCLLIIGPMSIFDGMLFPLGCRIYLEGSARPKEAPGRVYILEALGFILAGPIFTYILITKFNSFQIAFLVGSLNLLSGFLLMRKGASSLFKKAFSIFFILLLSSIFCLLFFSNIPLKLHNLSLSKQWKNQKLVAYQNSIYGNLAVTQKEEQYTFYSNGIPFITIPTPDITWTEEFIHFGLLAHSDPKKILFLGGGAGGPINEALKYPVSRVDYAELNPLLIKLLGEYPKEMTKKELSDPRINLVITDGARFVKVTDTKYDVVFINLPFPSTLSINRYYTKEFFNHIRAILSENGKLVFALPGSLSYINEELRELNLCIFTTLKSAFSFVNIIPGYANIYIASTVPFDTTPEIFVARIKERNIQTKSLDEFHIQDRLKEYWRDWFYSSLKKRPTATGPGAAVKENNNLAPVGVFYGVSYWNSLFNPQLRRTFTALNTLSFGSLIFCIIIFEALLLAIKYLFKLRGIGVSLSMLTTGFAGMSLNLILILAYQVFFGYMYHHIALLVTSFMLGIMIGGYCMTKDLERIRRGMFYFIILEILIAFFCVDLGLFLKYLNGMGKFDFYPLFYFFSIVAGILVGLEFPLANKLYQHEAGMEKTAGRLYALDLLGGFFAALLVSIVLVPIFGVVKTCVFLAALKIAGLILYISIRE